MLVHGYRRRKPLRYKILCREKEERIKASGISWLLLLLTFYFWRNKIPCDMDFKIDTRDTFSVITPVSEEITVKLTGELHANMEKMRQSGSQNFIVNLEECKTISPDAIDGLVTLHEECYSMETSLVFTGIAPAVMAALKENETDLLLNVAPKMIEAIDIISMEILERDLFNEES